MFNGSFVIGFIDFSVEVKTQYLIVDDRSGLPTAWRADSERKLWLFEVKPKIPSVSEVIRQVRLYQSYQPGRYFVVSEEQGIHSYFEKQGIGFISYYPPNDAGSLL